MKKTALKVVLILLCCFCAKTKSFAQCNRDKFEQLVKLGLKYAASSDFKNALNKYNAAKLVCSEKSAFVDDLIEDIYTKIKEEKSIAEKAEQLVIKSQDAENKANRAKIEALKASILQQKILQNHDSAFKLHIEANDLRERDNLTALQKERLANELYPNKYLGETVYDIYSKTNHVYTKSNHRYDYQAKLKFINQGKKVLVLESGNPKLIDLEADTVITFFEGEVEFLVEAIDITPELDRIAVAINEKPFYIYDRIKKVKREFPEVKGNIENMVFSANGKSVLIANKFWSNNAAIQLLNLEDSTVKTLTKNKDTIKGIVQYSISDNGKFVVLVNYSGNLFVWDIDKNTIIKGQGVLINNKFLSFKNDNKAIMSFSDTGLLYYNLKGEITKHVVNNGLKNADLVSFSSDGSYIYSNGFNMCFVNKFGDSTKFKCNDGVEGSGEGEVEALTQLFALDSAKFISVKREVDYRLSIRKYQMIDLSQGKIELDKTAELNQFSISDKGDLLLYSYDSTSFLYSVESGKKLWEIKNNNFGNEYEIFPDWSTLLIKEEDNLISVDMVTGKTNWKLKVDKGYPYQTAFLDEGKKIVFSSSKLIMILDVATGKLVNKKTIDYWGGPISINSSPNSKYVFLVYQNFSNPFSPILWDLTNDKLIDLPQCYNNMFSKFSANEKYFVYFAYNDSAIYWPLDNSKTKFNYQEDFPNLEKELYDFKNRYTMPNFLGRYSKDNSYFAKLSSQFFGGEANSLMLYDSTQKLLKIYNNIGCCINYIPNVGFSQNNAFIAIQNEFEKRIYVVKVPKGIDEFLTQYSNKRQQPKLIKENIRRLPYNANPDNVPPPPPHFR